MRIILGRLAENVYANVEKTEDDLELANAIEQYLTDKGWKSFWLSEGLNHDYALLLIGETKHEGIFLWLSPTGLYIIDIENISENPVVAQAFAYMVANFFWHADASRWP